MKITLDVTEEQADELRKQFEKKEIKTIYNLKEGDTYFYLDDTLDVIDNQYDDDEIDNKRLSIWNVFLTEEEAEEERAKTKARAIIKKWSVENDWGYEFVKWEHNYYIFLHFNNTLDYGCFSHSKCDSKYYSSIDKVKQAIKELKEEYELLLLK